MLQSESREDLTLSGGGHLHQSTISNVQQDSCCSSPPFACLPGLISNGLLSFSHEEDDAHEWDSACGFGSLCLRPQPWLPEVHGACGTRVLLVVPCSRVMPGESAKRQEAVGPWSLLFSSPSNPDLMNG